MTTNRHFIMIAALAATVFSATAKDVAGSKDHPLVGRYEGSEIQFYKQSEFDSQRLLDRALDFKQSEVLSAANSQELEGKVFRIRYQVPKDRSGLEVFRNYEASLKSKGFEPVFTCANEQCINGSTSFFRFGSAVDEGGQNFRYQKSVRYVLAKLARPQGDVFAAVLVGETNEPVVRVTVVEMKPIETDKIAFVDASAMEKSIAALGHVTLYGVLFDTDKAEIKPESKPTLDEIAKFMKANPAINLIVAGHTDNQGAFDYNVDLSRRRASAVVQALVGARGVAASRLVPFGAGMAAPVAPNDAEAGRAKNRRVELVKR